MRRVAPRVAPKLLVLIPIKPAGASTKSTYVGAGAGACVRIDWNGLTSTDRTYLKPDLVVAQNTAQSTISKIAESSYVKIVPDSDILDKSLFLLCVELCVGKRRSRLLDAEVDF